MLILLDSDYCFLYLYIYRDPIEFTQLTLWHEIYDLFTQVQDIF